MQARRREVCEGRAEARRVAAISIKNIANTHTTTWHS